MQEPLDLLNFMNGTGTQMPERGFSDPSIGRRAPNNLAIPIPSGITSLTFNKGGFRSPDSPFQPLPDLSIGIGGGIAMPPSIGIGGLLPDTLEENLVQNFSPMTYEQAIARQGQRDVKSAEENARIQAAIAQGPGPTGAVMQKPNDVPAQTPTPPIINGTGTQMPEGGFPIPDIFAGRNPLSLPGSSGFEAQAFSSSIKPTGYQEGGFVSSKEGISGLMAMLAGNADKRPRNEGFFVGGDIPPDPYNIGDRGFLVEPPEDGLREMYPELSPEDIEAIRRVMFMRQQKLDAKRIDR